jgi:integrase/recombinase XerD
MVAVKEAVQLFLEDCAMRNRPRTAQTYAYVLRPLVASLGDRAVDSLTPDELCQYVAAMRQQTSRYQGAHQRPEQQGGLSDETVRSRVRQLRAFFAWCVQEYKLPDNPMRLVKMPRPTRPVPKANDLNDLRRLLLACDDSPFGRRDRAVLAFLADTGARAGGLLSLTMENLKLEEGRAIVLEKGGRSRIVPFGPFTAQVLREWLEVRPREAKTVFCALHPKWYGVPLTLSGLHRILRHLKRVAKVTGRVNPHAYRHGFAREWLRNRGDLGTLSRILGHSSPTVTLMFYAVFEDEEALEAHEQFSPLHGFRMERDD